MAGEARSIPLRRQQLWDVAAEEMVSRAETDTIGETESYDVELTEAEATEETPRKSKQLPKLPVEAVEAALTDAELDSMTRNLPGETQQSARDAQTSSPQFQRWFGESKVVDLNGNPKVMYHGTRTDKNFTVFDTWGSNFGLFGVGSYFTDDKAVAEGYTRKGKGSNPRVYEVYLSIENPLDMDAAYDPAIWQTDDQYLNRMFEGSQTNEEAFRRLKEYCADEDMERSEAEEFITDLIVSKGFDGIRHTGGGRYSKGDTNRHEVYIAFEPEQIKSATENVGTFDAQNPDIRYSVREVNGNKVVWLDEDVMAQNTSGKSVLAFIRDYIIDHLDDVYTIAESGYQVHPDRKLPGEYTRSEYTKQIANSRKLLRAKMRMVTGFGEMLEIATNRSWEPTKHKENKDAKYGVYKYTTRVAFDGKNGIEAYKAKLVILNASDGRKYLYDIEGIKKDVATATGLTQARKSNNAARQQTNNVNNSIPQSSGAVNSKIQQSARDLPTDAISIREYLGSMEPTDRMTETERDLLGRYQAHLKTLGEKEAAIAEQEEIIRTVPQRNEDGTLNAELQKAKNRIRLLREQAANKGAHEAAPIKPVILPELLTVHFGLRPTDHQLTFVLSLGLPGAVHVPRQVTPFSSLAAFAGKGGRGAAVGMAVPPLSWGAGQ